MGAHLIDLTGQRFGRLTVLERGEDYISPPSATGYGDRTVSPRWICQCDCGRRVLVMGASLRRGASRSCGCLRRERTIEGDLRRWERYRQRKQALQEPPDGQSITPGG